MTKFNQHAPKEPTLGEIAYMKTQEAMVNEEVANERAENEIIEIVEQESQVGKKEEKREENQSPPGNVLFPSKPSPIVTPLPFPQRFRKAKLDEQFATFFNMLKKLEVNILFAEALAQMSNYMKFMKEIMSNKNLNAYGIVTLSKSYSVIIQIKLLEKQRDLGSFTIPCAIGEHNFKKALCYLGASINLMPVSMVKKLKLGELNYPYSVISLDDRSFSDLSSRYYRRCACES